MAFSTLALIQHTKGMTENDDKNYFASHERENCTWVMMMIDIKIITRKRHTSTQFHSIKWYEQSTEVKRCHLNEFYLHNIISSHILFIMKLIMQNFCCVYCNSYLTERDLLFRTATFHVLLCTDTERRQADTRGINIAAL